MAKWIEYLLKKKPADEDMLMLEDAETHNNKRVSFSGIADWLIERALKKKYGEDTVLAPLDDSQEKEANDYIVQRFVHESK